MLSWELHKIMQERSIINLIKAVTTLQICIYILYIIIKLLLLYHPLSSHKRNIDIGGKEIIESSRKFATIWLFDGIS